MMTPEHLEEIRESNEWEPQEDVTELIAEIERQDEVISRLKEALREARCAAMPESACADEMENVCRGVDEDFPG